MTQEIVLTEKQIVDILWHAETDASSARELLADQIEQFTVVANHPAVSQKRRRYTRRMASLLQVMLDQLDWDSQKGDPADAPVGLTCAEAGYHLPATYSPLHDRTWCICGVESWRSRTLLCARTTCPLRANGFKRAKVVEE